MKKNYMLLLICFSISAMVQAQTTVVLNAVLSGKVTSADAKTNGDLTNICSTCDRGYLKFDLSSLSPSAVISAASLKIVAIAPTASSGSVLNKITSTTLDAATAGAGFYNTLNTATTVNTGTSWAGTVPITLNLPFTSAAFTPLQAAISAGQITYGVIRGSTNVYAFAGFANGTAANQPQLTITYTVPPACAGTPAAGTATSTAASACIGQGFTLNLTGGTSGSGITFQWQSSPASANTFSNLGSSQSTSPYTVSSQTAATDYRVITTCAASGLSSTSSIIAVAQNTFINCYCITSPSTGGTGDIITNVTMGTLNNTTTFVAPAYFTSYNNIPVDLAQSSTQNISITFGTDGLQHSAVWIDFNQNGIYDASENVAISTVAAAGSATVNYILTIPATATLGQTRMRVRGGSDGPYTAGGACTASPYGETEDYLVNITAPAACLAPTGVTVGSITINSASVSFTGAGTAYIVEYGTAGFTPGTGAAAGAGGTVVTGAASPIALAGLTPATTYNVYVRQDCTGSANGYSANTVMVSFTTAVACPAPTAVTIGSITTTSASVSFTAAGSAFIVEYGAVGFTPGTGAVAGAGGTVVAGASSPIAITGLSASTSYDVYVRQDCSGTGNGYSLNSIKVTFTTTCTNTTLPFSEGFNTSGTAVFPACFTQQIVSGTGNITFQTSSTSPATTPFEGTRFVYWNSFSIASTAETRLVSRGITTTGTSSVDVNFQWFNNNNASYSTGAYLLEGVQVQYSLDGTTWTDAGAFVPRHDATLAAGTAAWKLKTITLPAGAGNQATVYVGFKFHSSYGDNCSLDAMNVLATPVCSAPTGVSVGSITTTTASVSFTGAGTAYIVEYGLTGFTPGTGAGAGVGGTAVTTASSPASLSGLTPSAAYQVYVRQDCTGSANGYSTNAGPVSFNTAGPMISSVMSGDWNNPATWNTAAVPVCADSVIINNTHNVTVTTAGNSGKAVTIVAGGTLSVNSGDVTMGCTNNNNTFTANGTLTVSGGTLNINGRLLLNLLGTFNQSGGNINIDGNAAGAAANSVAAGNPIMNLNVSNLTSVNLTGGILTIVDPHASTTATNTIQVTGSTSGTVNVTSNHTIRFGDGVSTDAGGNAANGFAVDTWTATTGMQFGNVILTGPAGSNRFLNSVYQQPVIGNLVINSGGESRIAQVFINGNLTVNSGGIFTSITNLGMFYASFLDGASLVFTPSSSAQTISGSGIFRNLATAPTAELSGFIVDNSNTAGVTISTPLRMSGTFGMTSGRINTDAVNLLTLGFDATNTGTLTYTAGNIVGPFKRWINTATGSRQFPMGDGTNRKNADINFTTAPATAGSLTARWSTTPPAAPEPVLMEGALTVDKTSTQGSWFIDAGDALAGGTYTGTFTANGSTDIVDFAKTVLIKRPTAGGAWVLNGTHVTTTGSNTAPVLRRTGMIGFSEFAIGGQAGSVLPVTVDYFRGSKLAGANYLDWKVTCTSSPSVTLILERSGDGRNFKAINSQTETAARCLQGFNYTDATPLAGMNYYRLKTITPDGDFRYSVIVALLNKDKGFELVSIAPNPLKALAVLSVTTVKGGKMTIAVSDMTGKVVMTQSVTVIAGNNPVNMNFATLSAGTYNITVVNAENEMKTTRFVKF